MYVVTRPKYLHRDSNLKFTPFPKGLSRMCRDIKNDKSVINFIKREMQRRIRKLLSKRVD